MSRRGNYDGGNLRRTLPESMEENNGTALLQVLDDNVEELLWIAVVMAGSGQAGEQSLAEAMELAEAAPYVGREWMLSWIKRLLVHVALRQISGEILELPPSAGTRSAVTPTRAGVSALDRQSLRTIPSQWMIASFDVLERACFILHTYLEYPVLDCALLLGCPRGWIEPISEGVLTGIVVSGSSGFLDHPLHDEGVPSSIEPGDLLAVVGRLNRVEAASRQS